MTNDTIAAAQAYIAAHRDAARAAGRQSPSGDARLWQGPEGFFFTSDHHNHARLASFIGLVDPGTGALVATRF